MQGHYLSLFALAEQIFFVLAARASGYWFVDTIGPYSKILKPDFLYSKLFIGTFIQQILNSVSVSVYSLFLAIQAFCKSPIF